MLAKTQFATNAAGKLHVLRHDGDTLGVDGAKVGIFKQANHICLSSLLKGQHRGSLETQIRLEVLSDFTNQTLERQFAEQ